MPSGAAVSVTGPWIADAARPTCVECHTQFGFLTRRHHCRRCGEIFCGKCSKYASKHIPGLDAHRGQALRVCKCCFLRHLAYMVVARGAFGVKFELFGSLEDAEKHYDKCKRSKLLVAMRNSQRIKSHFESGAVGQRLLHKAQGARNFLLGGHQIAAQLVHDPLDTSRVTFQNDSPTRPVTAGAWAIVFVAEFGGSRWAYSVHEIKGATERQAAVEAFMAAAKANKEVTKAAVMTLRGFTVLGAYGAGALTRTTSVVASAQSFVRSLPCFLVLHIGGHCSTRRHSSLNDGLSSVDQLPHECSAILLTPQFEVLARHRCDVASFVEELLNHAGDTILRTLHNATRVAVVSARDVVSVTSNLNAALSAARTEQITHRQTTIALVALPSEESYRNGGRGPRTPHDALDDEREPAAAAIDLDAIGQDLVVLRTFATEPTATAKNTLASLPQHRLTQAARSLISAVQGSEGDDAAAASHHHDQSYFGGTPGPSSSPFPVGSSGSANPNSLEVLTCSVCMEFYNTAARRPVMCPSCGNTICLECWQLTRQCPMSRCEKPPRPVFNIALQHLLENDGIAD